VKKKSLSKKPPSKRLPPKKPLLKKIAKVKKKKHISVSQINAGECKLYYKEVYLNPRRNKGNVFTEGGKFVHKVIYLYTGYCVEHKTDSDFEVMDKLIDIEFPKYKIPESMYQGLRDILLKFAENGMEFDIILAFEQEVTIEFASGKFIKVIIDRLNSYTIEDGSVIEVLDYKNEMRMRNQSDINDDLQLKVYVWAVLKYLYPGFDRVRWGIHNTRYNKTIWNGPSVPVVEMSKEIEGVDKFLLRQWDRLIVSDNYEPMNCQLCWKYGHCPLNKEYKCPLFTKKEVEKMKAGSEKNVVRALRKVDNETGALKEKMQHICRTKEPFDVDGIMVGYFSNEQQVIDLSDMVNLCREKKIPLTGIEVSIELLKKAAKKVMDSRDIDRDSDFKEKTIVRRKTVFKYK